MKNWIIVGATSAIAEATARIWAARGYKLFLVARNNEKLGILKNDLEVRGAQLVGVFEMDANDIPKHQKMLDQAETELGAIDGILIAHGTLPDQESCQNSVQMTLDELNTNAMSIISLLTDIANRFEKNSNGNIAVISSVAGDRGRQSNYVYGTAKAAVSTFLQGLRNRLAKHGVHVLTIKPGFVDTPMTAQFDKGGPLWATPDKIADGIVMSVDKKRNIVYLPWFWWGIMNIIRHIPEFIFKKLSL